MFQTFETTADPSQGAGRLAALRQDLRRKGLAGVIVPRADVHQGENVAPRDERLAWLTGFTGSAGFCIALLDRAGVFVDGRYRTQVKSQVDPAVFTPVDWPEVKAGDWLAEALPKGGRVAYDPWLATLREVEEIAARLEGTGVELVAQDNLVDRIWTDRPAAPVGQVGVHPLSLAGEASADKRARIAADLRAAGQKAAVLTLPESLCWLLNIRGADIAHTPVVQALGLIRDDGSVDLFIDAAKVGPEARAHLGPEVRLHPPGGFSDDLATLTGPVRVDRATAPIGVTDRLKSAGIEVVHAPDPCLAPKARKNPAEVAGMVEAHLRDGAAVAEFLAWLDANPDGQTEISLVERLEQARRATNALRDISFDTISGAGPNGAIMHYRVTHDTDRAIGPGDLVVLDSGAQYQDGTTDVTRTLIPLGTPSPEARAAFTRVLQGMIAMSRLRWPKGLAGAHLDAIARAPLWMAHQDYNHGTGHGVGAFLGVHEGPAGLSRRYETPIEAGMILSNEPGYYLEGAFGIRIENLVLVEEAPPLPGGDAEREMLMFRTLTLVPIDRRLIEAPMLTRAEVDWIDAYHAQVLAGIGPRVSSATRDWLVRACAPLG